MENFHPIDLSKWERKEYFDHYFSAVPCTYSMTVKLDITRLVQSKEKLYPAMLYCLAKAVNRSRELKTVLSSNGQLGWFEKMHPSYTIFHKDTETFSCIWTAYTEDYQAFCQSYHQDLAQYGDIHHFDAKPNTPPNSFPVSMIPWESFEGFNLNLQKGFDYLTPIFTMGKYYEENGRFLLPLAIQVHHAVCDGYHVCRFVSHVREALEELPL